MTLPRRSDSDNQDSVTGMRGERSGGRSTGLASGFDSQAPQSLSETSGFDSRPDTYEHIEKVRGMLLGIAVNLITRGHTHDASKLEEPELSVFNEYTPKLRDSTYGSDEYKRFLEGMGEGLNHHYRVNRHHPEHFRNGIADMNLLDLIEMLADWKAATLRHADGNLSRSITQNRERFGYGDEIERLLRNTAIGLGWLEGHTHDLEDAAQ